MIFHIIGIVIVTMFTAVGLLYVLRENIYLMAVLAVIPAVAYAFTVDFLKKAKEKTAAGKSEIVYGAIHGILAIAYFFMFFHGINIEFVRKDAIRKAAYNKLETTDQLFTDYEKEVTKRLAAFDTEVRTAYSVYKRNATPQKMTVLVNFLGTGVLDFKKPIKQLDAQVDKGIDKVQTAMKRGWDLSIAKKNWENQRKQKKAVIDNWNRLSISFHYYDIDSRYKDAYAAALVKMPDFKYSDTLKGADIALDKPIAAMGHSSVLSILLLLLFYAFAQGLVLLPYVMTKRNKRKLGNPIGPTISGDYKKTK